MNNKHCYAWSISNDFSLQEATLTESTSSTHPPVEKKIEEPKGAIVDGEVVNTLHSIVKEVEFKGVSGNTETIVKEGPVSEELPKIPGKHEDSFIIHQTYKSVNENFMARKLAVFLLLVGKSSSKVEAHILDR
eukprot:UN05326